LFFVFNRWLISIACTTVLFFEIYSTDFGKHEPIMTRSRWPTPSLQLVLALVLLSGFLTTGKTIRFLFCSPRYSFTMRVVVTGVVHARDTVETCSPRTGPPTFNGAQRIAKTCSPGR
jgi:hypothetical protein